MFLPSPVSIRFWTCCPGIYLIPLWPCWHSLPPQPPMSARSTSSISQCKEVLTFFQLIHHFHDFVNLSQGPLCKRESQPLSSLLLRQLLHLLDHLLACLCHFPYSTTPVLRCRSRTAPGTQYVGTLLVLCVLPCNVQNLFGGFFGCCYILISEELSTTLRSSKL